MDANAEGRRKCWVARRDGRIEEDWVAVEEPLEIRVNGKPVAVTMRTPGQDRQLAAGFLFTEGLLQHRGQIETLQHYPDPARPGANEVIGLLLEEGVDVDPERMRQAQRDFLAAAGCGLCGKTSIEDVFQRWPTIEPLDWRRDLLGELPERMRAAQKLFADTGGLHAAALFNPEGELLTLFEDIGRHNAVDKVIGHALLEDWLPLRQHVLVVSSRAGFEIVQKALMAAIPTLVAVGAASSLAVQLAGQKGMELYSFTGRHRGNRHLQADRFKR